FKTYIPTGSPGQGLSVGHVSLEPAFLYNLRLGPQTYLQGMTAYWIPISGDDVYQANIWHNHWSLNHVLCCPCNGLQLIGTLELTVWKIFGGAYTVTDIGNDTAGTVYVKSASTTILNGGPGIRAVICDKIDVGVGSALSMTGPRWFEEVVRAEFRWRF